MKPLIPVLVLLSLLFAGCRNKATSSQFAMVPEWATEAIWYQIFPERFRNGDPGNNPTPADMKGSYPDTFPASWSITPWGHDWYAREKWLDSIKADGFYSRIQARRYGGDLQGVLDKIGYLQELGINAIYFNPLNDAPSLHKYDARNYAHIDRNFGPDPKGDVQIMNSEVPYDPATWKWTSADKLFLTVVDECHKRGIKVIMDYSWNHTGKDFWALEDVRKNGEKSAFKDWYIIISYDNPATKADEFRYKGWGGNNPWMPVFRKEIIPPTDTVMPFEGNLYAESLRQHIFNVTRRWLDPDKDGNPSDGVDGFRLDVAAEVPMGFWREYRKVVRAVNPNAYLVGEVWYLKWPDKFLDPRVFLKGDQFDAVMNYRWYRIARGFFGQAPPVLNASGFVRQIDSINRGIRPDNLKAMMNVAATHDTPRLSTSLFNKNPYKYKDKPSDNPDYKIYKPDELTRKEQMLLLVHQFTFIGAPHIWNGDEAGMWGADDPDCRKPLVWNDLGYEDEKANYFPDKPRPVDVVKVDTALVSYYKKLIRMRKDNPVLVHGDLKFIKADDKMMVLAYTRTSGNDVIIAVFNRSENEQTVRIPAKHKGKYVDILSDGQKSYSPSGSAIELVLEPISAAVLKKVTNP
ncbi:MAG: glycoside hydrolase family 13 protein [Bacteroidales bacterium]